MRKPHQILTLLLLPASLWAATITGQVQIRFGINTLTGYSGAKVVLSTGAGANVQPEDSSTSDSAGHYTFSNVTTGLKQVTASAANFQDTTRTVFIRSANRTATVNLELKRAVGTLSGTVRSNAADSASIPNALVLCLGMMNSVQIIDSVRTDSLGNYSIALPYGSYEIQISASGFKSTLANPFQDTTISIVQDSTTTLNVILAPATSTIAGIVHVSTSTGPVLGNARVILQRRNSPTDAFYTLDTTYTDVNGIYVFDSLIASGGTGVTATAYRLTFFKIDSANNVVWSASSTNLNPFITANIILAIGETHITNGVLTSYHGDVFDAITPSGNITYKIRFSIMGNQLILNLPASTTARTIEVVNLSGKLRQRFGVARGVSQVFLPASYAPEKGFLFLMK